MLKYLFFNWRFDRYAAQVERLIQLEMMLLTMQVVRGKPYRDEKLDKLKSQFQRNREATTQAMHQFKQHTKTWGGWVCSFIPTTRACRARRRVAGLLSHAKRQHGLLQVCYVGRMLSMQTRVGSSAEHAPISNNHDSVKSVAHQKAFRQGRGDENAHVQGAGLSINSGSQVLAEARRSGFFR